MVSHILFDAKRIFGLLAGTDSSAFNKCGLMPLGDASLDCWLTTRRYAETFERTRAQCVRR
jgi:hypothetical protein